MSLSAVALATLLQVASGVAPLPTPTPTSTPRPRMICRASRAQTGSMLMGPRTCHTVDQWRAIDRDERNNADNLRDQMNRAAPPR